jgi:uncharacterized protein (DUF697 family)
MLAERESWRKREENYDMAGIKDVSSIWKNVREVDLRPIRDSALQSLRIAVVGRVGSGRHTLANQMRVDPAHPNFQAPTPIKILNLEDIGSVAGASLIILVLDASQGNFEEEEQVAQRLGRTGNNVLVFVNKVDLLAEGHMIQEWIDWPVERIAYGSAIYPTSLQKQFVPVIMEMLPESHLALARQFPFFRQQIATHLINDTSFSNAAYALSTGLAEVFPALGIPLNIADMVVLTKAQAFLVYRLGLLLGLSTEWKEYVGEFGSVLGGGFVWRQLARSMIGFIPVWGIVPKVGVAYAGTYVVGHTVLRWYLTGKHLTPRQMRELYRQAFDRGKRFARDLIGKWPRPRLGWRRKPAALPAPAGKVKACPHCAKPNSVDASYCQYCGLNIDPGLETVENNS